MIFGEGLEAPPDAEAASWLTGTPTLELGTVGGLVPNHYDSYLRIEAAGPDVDDWWTAQQEIISALAGVLSGFTGTPERAWFAIWEGHGYDNGGGLLVARDADPAWVAAAVADEHAKAASIRGRLAAIPRFDLPHRRYYLVTGHTLDVAAIRWPSVPPERGHWFRPDLWWPDDRSWFVATDVDFWSTYLGGTSAMTDAVAAQIPGCRRATLHDPLPDED